MNGEILLICEAGYPDAIGGVTTWINDLVGGLRDLPIVVLGIRFEGPDAEAPAVLPGGARFIDVRVPAPAVAPAVIERVLAAAAGRTLSVVHATSSGLAGLAGAAISEASGAPLVVTEHGIAWLEGAGLPLRLAGPQQPGGGDGGNRGIGPGQGGSQGGGSQGGGGQGGGAGSGGHGGGGGGSSVLFWHPEGRRVARMVYAKAARVTSVSHANAALQRRLAPAHLPIEVIPNGVDAPPVETDCAGGAPRVVVFVGRLAREKGVDRFVRAAALLGKVQPDLRFEVRGPDGEDAEYVAACRRMAAATGLGERLRFTGPLPRERVFAGADLLIAPSRAEACPYAALEAMAAGVPAVVARVGDCAGIVGEAGIAVCGDAAAFAAAARELLDRDRHAAAARAGGARVRTWFTRERMLARYAELYAGLERRRRRPRWTA